MMEKYILGHQPRPRPKRPPIFGTYTRADCMRNNNQILHGDQTRGRENSRSTMNADARSVCGRKSMR